ncbi:MAG: helix-turn-helix transcriptional regulator [Actinobacteria bacterium]|nr:helix-turn-helix transcriptional regulator [Actinomycetota bacterium]
MPRQPTSSRVHSAHAATFGAAVRELRACRELSQEELGFRAKLHRNYVGALERGEINPTFRTLRTLADGLDVELSSLIRLYEERAEERWRMTPAA